MTHGKANNHSHRIPQQFGALLQQRPVVEGSAYDNFATAGKKIQPPGAKPQPLVNLQKTRSTSLTVSKQPLREDISRRCAGSLQAQSTVLRGGVIACANHRQGAAFGPVRTSEQLFSEKCREKIFPASAWSHGHSGRMIRSRGLPSAPRARSGMPASSSKASASRTRGPCTRSTDIFSKIEIMLIRLTHTNAENH